MSARDDVCIECEVLEALALRQKFLEMRDGARAMAIDCERTISRLEAVLVNYQNQRPRRISPEEINHE